MGNRVSHIVDAIVSLTETRAVGELWSGVATSNKTREGWVSSEGINMKWLTGRKNSAINSALQLTSVTPTYTVNIRQHFDIRDGQYKHSIQYRNYIDILNLHVQGCVKEQLDLKLPTFSSLHVHYMLGR